MKVVKIVFWLYHCVEEEETKPLLKTASKSNVGNRHTRRRGDCPRAQTRATRHTRLLHPDELTRPEYQTTRPTCQTRIRMTSSWRNHDASIHSQQTRQRPVSMPCQRPVSMTRQHSGSHLPRHQTQAEPSWAEPSRFGAEPSQDPRDKILCSGVYVQPDLRLNLGRSSGQNCFDQILAVWNAIWTISDFFPANLIVPDAMVRSDCWDLRPKVVVVN